jgi:hypothetical protein
MPIIVVATTLHLMGSSGSSPQKAGRKRERRPQIQTFSARIRRIVLIITGRIEGESIVMERERQHE